MKNLIKYIIISANALLVSTILDGCSAENPFDGDGTGTVHLRTVVNSITTRAEDDDDTQNREQALRDNCVVYISSEKGLIYKEKGLDNVQESFTLKTGKYVAEAWSGDSVTASYDKMFFRAYQPFEVQAGDTKNVSLDCKIQNVVVSLNTNTIDPNLMKDDYVVTVKNTRGELTFDKNNAAVTRGYFMMPDGDNDIEISIAGTRKDGEPFTKKETIKNVQRAHHYILNFAYNPGIGGDEPMGAVFLSINIKDENLDDVQNITVPSGPTVSGLEFNINKQQVYTDDSNIPENGLSVKVCAFGDGFSKVNVASDSYSALDLPSSSFNVLGLSDINKTNCINAGLSWTNHDYKQKTNVSTMFLTFSKDLLKKLPANDNEHQIMISVTDKNGLSTTMPIRIARSENAIIIEDPIVVDQVDVDNWKNVSASAIKIPYTLASEVSGTIGIEYRKLDATEPSWNFIAINNPVPGKKETVTITGLESGTTYQYRACWDDVHSDDIKIVETYKKFIIPNADMENWSSVDNYGEQNGVMLPTTIPGKAEFWGNGNPGAKVAGTILTEGSTEKFHSASKSARLESKFASVFGIGKFAAGNLFSGVYVKTDGTNGVLSFGQKFTDFTNDNHVDCSPKALKVYVHYTPGIGTKSKGANNSYIKQGDPDKGQIYFALATKSVDIKTGSGPLFSDYLPDPNGNVSDDKKGIVLAYGQHTFDSEYGNADGSMKELIIPIEYFDTSVRPSHLVIVCSASLYGDYFSGGVGSTMYVDDFELVY